MHEQSSVGIGHYLMVLKRQWMPVVAMALLGGLAALGYLYVVPGKVVASTLVNINVIVSDPFNPSRPASGLLDAATESALASSYVVADDAATQLHSGDNAAQLQEGVSVSVGPNSTTVKIAYSSDSPARAQAGADAIARSYLAYRQSQAEARKATMLDQFDKQLAALAASLKTAAPVDRTAITNRASNIENQMNQLRAVATTGGEILTPAAQNPTIRQPQSSTLVMAGLLVGLTLGVILAFIFNALGRRVRDSYDIERSTTAPVMADLALTESSIPARGGDLNDFRALRERLLAACPSPLGVLTVADGTRGSGSSDVAPNLAVVLAQAGTPVDLMVPGASEAFMGLLTDGLSLSPAEGCGDDNEQLLISARIPGLTVVRTFRSHDGEGADELISRKIQQRAAERSPGRAVVLALPAGAATASVLASARLSGAVLLVAEKRWTKNSWVAATTDQLGKVGVALVAVALVRGGRTAVGQTTAPGRRSAHERLDRESVGVGAD